jgi:hypothetical protein
MKSPHTMTMIVGRQEIDTVAVLDLLDVMNPMIDSIIQTDITLEAPVSTIATLITRQQRRDDQDLEDAHNHPLKDVQGLFRKDDPALLQRSDHQPLLGLDTQTTLHDQSIVWLKVF